MIDHSISFSLIDYVNKTNNDRRNNFQNNTHLQQSNSQPHTQLQKQKIKEFLL